MFSVRRTVLFVLPAGRDAACCCAGCCVCACCVCAGWVAGAAAADGEDVCGCGRFAAVPGTPEAIRVVPLVSSVFCELTITERVGSNVSSLCSPLVMSTSAQTPVRNLSEPKSGSNVLL